MKLKTKSLDKFQNIARLKPIKNKDKNQDKQLIVTRPTPAGFPFRLNPAAVLVPAIPTLIGFIVNKHGPLH